jgi:hypothetical protein
VTETEIAPGFEQWAKALELQQQHVAVKAYHFALAEAGLSIDAGEEEPFFGFYRILYKDGRSPDAVYITQVGGEVIYLLNGEPVERKRVWPRCWPNVVSYENYCAKVHDDNRREWLDYAPAESANWRDTDESPPIGDNAPPKTELEEFTEKALREATRAKSYEKIASDDELKASETVRSALAAIANEATKVRKRLVEPHLRAQREINAAWNQVIERAEAIAQIITKAQNAWNNHKRLERERAEAERERLEEEQRKAHEEAANKAAAENAPPPPPPPPVTAPPTAPVLTQFRGATGKMRKVVDREIIKEVTDWPAFIGCYTDDDKIRERAMQLGQRQIDKTGEIPAGVITETSSETV